ncbi:MAG: hypothetical protein AAGE96_21280 [Cyanobacteria bacterium P01_G01_bin.19]
MAYLDPWFESRVEFSLYISLPIWLITVAIVGTATFKQAVVRSSGCSL